jgi:RNA polymerase sigma-70 factor (ECF subfamily)
MGRGVASPFLRCRATARCEQRPAAEGDERGRGLERYLRVVAPSAAEDLAAETWLSVIRGLARFRGEEPNFRAWVFTAARHRAVDWQRQAARRPVQPLPVEQLVDRAAPDDPAAAAVAAESTQAALALLAELPADQAEVVALRVLGGLEVAEVAEITGKRPGAVRVLAHRGLRRLASRLEGAGLARGVTR